MTTNSEYRTFVKERADSESNRTFYNDGAEDAVVVLSNIFSHSKKEVYLFSGSLDATITAHNDFISSLKSFFSNDGVLKVIISDESINSVDDLPEPISTVLKTYLIAFPNQIQVKKSNATVNFKGKDVHFAVGDSKMYRIEYDTKKFAAECCFNDTNTSSKLINTYNAIFSDNRSTTLPFF